MGRGGGRSDAISQETLPEVKRTSCLKWLKPHTLLAGSVQG